MRVAITILLAAFTVAASAQRPDTVRISARSVAPVYSHVVLQQGTKYVLQASGRISYWRATMPVDTPDADAAFVFHVPYVVYALHEEVDSLNTAIGQFQYLPADGSSCSTVPAEFGCGTITNRRALNLPFAAELHLDSDYLEFNGDGFCPRNGGDKQRNVYWQGVMGNGQRAVFRIHDGDGDTTNNAGTLQVTITRLEPVCAIAHDSIDFGVVASSHPVAVLKSDSIINEGSPFFPGCASASANLRVTIAAFTGDTGANGFRLTNVAAGSIIDNQQGYASVITARFLPAESRAYRAVIHLITNDPQQIQSEIVLTGNGAGFVGVEERSSRLSAQLTMDIVPNPMISQSQLRLARDGRSRERMSIALYDILGRCVKTIFDGVTDQPVLEVNVDATRLPDGMYWCEAVTAHGTRVGRVVEVR